MLMRNEGLVLKTYTDVNYVGSMADSGSTFRY